MKSAAATNVFVGTGCDPMQAGEGFSHAGSRRCMCGETQWARLQVCSAGDGWLGPLGLARAISGMLAVSA